MVLPEQQNICKVWNCKLMRKIFEPKSVHISPFSSQQEEQELIYVYNHSVWLKSHTSTTLKMLFLNILLSIQLIPNDICPENVEHV